MKTILDYIEEYGNYSFEESNFNEIDSVILTDLSYINFDGIVHEKDKNKVTLKEAAIDFFNKYSNSELKRDGIGLIAAYEILSKIQHKKRYKYLKLYNYYYVGNDDTQFCALTIDIDDKTSYISIEGTDDLVSGWKEDFELSYKFPIKSHIYSINYLNKTIKILTNRKYYIGGHSKGGNLALVGAMYLNKLKFNKVIKVFNYDGPGLRYEQVNSLRYKKVLPKFELIIPNYSVVGLLLNHTNKYIIYKSNTKGILAHNTLTWEVEDNHFIKCDKLSDYSIELDKTFTKWIDNYDDNTKKVFIDDLFNIFTRAGIEDLRGLNSKNINDLYRILKEMGNINPTSYNMLKDLFKLLFNNIKTDTISYIESKFVKQNK